MFWFPRRDTRPTPTRLRALFGVSMALGGRMGETRTNLKKGSAAERLTDYLNYILGMTPIMSTWSSTLEFCRSVVILLG